MPKPSEESSTLTTSNWSSRPFISSSPQARRKLAGLFKLTRAFLPPALVRDWTRQQERRITLYLPLRGKSISMPVPTPGSSPQHKTPLLKIKTAPKPNGRPSNTSAVPPSWGKSSVAPGLLVPAKYIQTDPQDSRRSTAESRSTEQAASRPTTESPSSEKTCGKPALIECETETTWNKTASSNGR